MRIPVRTDPATGAPVPAPPAPSPTVIPARAAPVDTWGPTLFRAGAAALAVIWVAVALISAFSPDMVTGSEQDHLPIAAILTWVWGLVASRSVVTALIAQRDRPGRAGDVWLLVGAVAAVWAVATAVAIWGPVLVSGADPTTIPICAILVPIAAMVLTTTLCQVQAALLSHHDRS